MMQMWNRIVLIVSLALIAMTETPCASPAPDVFDAHVFNHTDGKPLPYRLLRPHPFDPAKEYPLVLFLHGAGERGMDNVRQLKNGVGVFAREVNRTKFPCFVVVPQCESTLMWVDTPWSLDAHSQPEKPTEPMRLSMELLKSLQKEFKIDSKRLYIAGVSMGGFGTWDAIMRYPNTFAAAVPCCGGADDSKVAQLAGFPIWTFHGDNDNVVKTIRTRHVIEAIKKAGGDPKYTEYPGVAHDCWTKAFNEPQLLDWLFSQTKK